MTDARLAELMEVQERLLARIHVQLQDMEYQQAKILVCHAALAMDTKRGVKAATEVEVEYVYRCPWCFTPRMSRDSLVQHTKDSHAEVV